MDMPCNNCITFAICYSSMKTRFGIGIILSSKCSIFNKYYLKYGDDSKKLGDILKVFGRWNDQKRMRDDPVSM